ncbi:MAG: DUF547 domain-containing protein [Candidatus Kariarchaeaceae archaeon]
MDSQFEISNISVLQKYIENGRVDYSKLKNDPWLNENIKKIQTTDISSLNIDEQFAFWLNAYNLLTIKSVCNELENNPAWKGNMSLIAKLRFFILRKHEVAYRKLSLYHIENKILRKEFKDPRIHFALNCASTSCPFLPGQLFQASNLDEYLDNLTFNFFNQQIGIDIENSTIFLSKIFKWYKKDFDKSGGVLSFIKKYWRGKTPIPANPTIKYVEYDWGINAQLNKINY